MQLTQLLLLSLPFLPSLLAASNDFYGNQRNARRDYASSPNYARRSAYGGLDARDAYPYPQYQSDIAARGISGYSQYYSDIAVREAEAEARYRDLIEARDAAPYANPYAYPDAEANANADANADAEAEAEAAFDDAIHSVEKRHLHRRSLSPLTPRDSTNGNPPPPSGNPPPGGNPPPPSGNQPVGQSPAGQQPASGSTKPVAASSGAKCPHCLNTPAGDIWANPGGLHGRCNANKCWKGYSRVSPTAAWVFEANVHIPVNKRI
ncbi:hypothetical protein MMC19_004341 [Ptychographa xylographoides]|nr:hypothetical protein [Ptychographa xylographoides]